mgnify:CR=1 FL=1
MKSSTRGRRLRQREPLALACALALAEAYFPQPDGTVSASHAHLLLTGRIDAWPGYWSLAEEDKYRIGALLRLRPDELASEEYFKVILRAGFEKRSVPGYHSDDHHTTGKGTVHPDHGLAPRVHADRLLADLEDLHRQSARLTATAKPGRYRTTLRVVRQGSTTATTRAVYNLTDLSEPTVTVPPVVDAPRADFVEFEVDALRKMAERIDSARGETHRLQRIDALFARLTASDATGGGVTALRIPSGGPISTLQAPTGFGKSVLLEVMGTSAAELGITIALVVPTRAAALGLAHRIETNLALLSIGARCVPLLSPSQLMADAEKAATDVSDGFGAWAYERLGYGCALAASAATDDEVDAWRPGHEPCRDLQAARPGGDTGRGPGDPSGGGTRYACPWRSTCGKFRLMREAVDADVIVTAHQTFFSGRMHIPLETTTGPAPARTDRLSVEEFVLRRCQVVAIDELDRFQAAVIGKSARHLVLADGPRGTPLHTLESEFRTAFGQIPAEIDGEVRVILSDLQLLSMGYTASLAHGWLQPVLPHRRGWRTDHWILPRGQDAWITARLLGLGPKGRKVEADEFEGLYRLFEDRRARDPAPLRLANIPEARQAQVREEISATLRAISAGCRDGILPVHSARLSRLLEPIVPDETTRGGVVERMIRRAYLEPLRHRLSELFLHTSHLRAVGAEAAEQIADALGGLTNWTAMPGSPLGRLFLAFKERYSPETPEQTKLSVAAFGGDPHGYVLYLGELTARARAGVPRAVLGLSATSYFPGAPHHHVGVSPTWSVPDTDERGVTIEVCQAFGTDGDPIRISGVQGRQRQKNLRDLGESLYRTTLGVELERLAARRERSGTRGQDLVLVATTSYAGCIDLAEGMARGGAAPADLCVVTRADDETLVLDSRWRTLTPDRIEHFPGTGARVLIAPLATVERGVNILDGDVSALGAIYLVVRPIPILDEPAELLAHINHRLWADQADDDDPLRRLEHRVKQAGHMFNEVVRAPQFFRSQPGWVQLGVAAEIIVSLIQLVGRARRGETQGRIRLVDQAFFEPSGRSDLATLIHGLRHAWASAGHLDTIRSLYGPTIDAFFDFADRRSAASSPE